jgi:elongation factor Tu
MRNIFKASHSGDDKHGIANFTPVRADMAAHAEFEAEVSLLHADQGGRHTPFFTNYQPRFSFDGTEVTGTIILPEGMPMAMPGEQVDLTVRLAGPVPMEAGQYFDIREGGRTIAVGRVLRGLL